MFFFVKTALMVVFKVALMGGGGHSGISPRAKLVKEGLKGIERTTTPIYQPTCDKIPLSPCAQIILTQWLSC